MSDSININESARQFMVLDVISRRIEHADKIKRTMKMNNNAKAAESLKAGSCFRYDFLPKERRIFMPKRVSTDSFAFNLSVCSRRVTLIFDS